MNSGFGPVAAALGAGSRGGGKGLANSATERLVSLDATAISLAFGSPRLWLWKRIWQAPITATSL